MFNPTQNVLEGIRNAFPLQLFPWDEYFPAMAEADWKDGNAEVIGVKSFFIRKAPFGGSYALLGGITAALRQIADLPLDSPDFKAGMEDAGYHPGFIKWLAEKKRIRAQVYSAPEGSVYFPAEPVITVVAPLPFLRLSEGIITRECNFPSLSLTKWYRLVRTVRPGSVFEFARRRAQDPERTTVYAMFAGCSITSNSEMRRFFDFLRSGTMGHEWVQRYGDVKKAFDAWLRLKPGKPIGLVDTKNCLKHDFPIWLDTVYEHREAIKEAKSPIWGWRNDSGDLAYLTIEQYVMFWKHPLSKDMWFKDRMRIILTNDLDEYKAAQIIAQIRTQAGAAGFDAEDILRRIIWAAGTQPGTCSDQPSIGGVMKLMEVDGQACIKLAFDAEGNPGVKTSIPGFNFSALIRNEAGEIECLLLYRHDEYGIDLSTGRFFIPTQGPFNDSKVDTVIACHPDNVASRKTITDYRAEPRQLLVFDSLHHAGFTRAWDNPTIKDVVERIKHEVDQLHWSVSRLDSPHVVKVSLSPKLFELRQRMIQQGVLREDFLAVEE